jgi:hypothetical protein
MTQSITIYRTIPDQKIFEIVPLSIHRDWMANSREKYAYKCLPLNIANQYGWAVLSPVDFSVSWYGGANEDSVEVTSGDPNFSEHLVISHFGEGTFTLQLDFIIKTPENYSTYIRGIPNKPDKILKPLDAIVETDWLPYTFTYNFMFTDTGIVDFKKGDPLLCFFPIERNSVENFVLSEQPLTDNAEMSDDYQKLLAMRLDAANKNVGKVVLQRFYNTTEAPHKKFKVKNHVRRLLFGGRSGTIEE